MSLLVFCLPKISQRLSEQRQTGKVRLSSSLLQISHRKIDLLRQIGLGSGAGFTVSCLLSDYLARKNSHFGMSSAKDATIKGTINVALRMSGQVIVLEPCVCTSTCRQYAYDIQ
jgi:hypothetical protein